MRYGDVFIPVPSRFSIDMYMGMTRIDKKPQALLPNSPSLWSLDDPVVGVAKYWPLPNLGAGSAHEAIAPVPEYEGIGKPRLPILK